MDQAEPTAVGGEHGESIGEADSSRRWTKGANAPFRGRAGNWFVDGSTIYFHPKFNGDRTLVYTYDIPTQKWSFLPWCGNRSMFSVAVINGMVTAIGGYETGIEGFTFYNTLLSLTGAGEDGKWVEQLPPMATKRSHTAVVHTGKYLIVAGGYQEGHTHLDTVEVLDIEKLQWSTASSLPVTICGGYAVLHGDDIYVQDADWSKFVAKCSLTNLLQSTPQLPSPWQEVAKAPIEQCTPTSMSGRLLAVGGYSWTGPTNKIHQYFPETNTWEVISQMPTARCYCLVAVLPGSKLMVVGGGVRTPYDYTDLVEIGTLH